MHDYITFQKNGILSYTAKKKKNLEIHIGVDTKLQCNLLQLEAPNDAYAASLGGEVHISL